MYSFPMLSSTILTSMMTCSDVKDAKMRTVMMMDVVMVARVARMTKTQMKMNPTKRSPKRVRVVKRRLRAAQVLLQEIKNRNASNNDD